MTVLSVFFWVFPQRQIDPQRQIVNLTPGKYPKEHRQYSKHGESLKSRMTVLQLEFKVHK
jgi:hypothetical protein